MYSHRHPPPLLLLYATATATATAESAASSATATVNETLRLGGFLLCPASFSLWSLFTGKLKHFSMECVINYAIALVSLASFGLGELFNQSDTELKPIAIESR